MFLWRTDPVCWDGKKKKLKLNDSKLQFVLFVYAYNLLVCASLWVNNIFLEVHTHIDRQSTRKYI